MNTTMIRLSFLLLTLLLVAATAWAQTGTSSIRGTVLDSQGSVIAGATVTLTNVNTSAARGQTTNKMGVYSFEFISPGEYKLEVEATGFNKSTVSNIRALVGSSTDKTITMSVGTVVETVSVQAAEVAVNTQDATLGNNFINQQIVQLPLEARNVLSLVTLQPQVTSTGYVAGARSDQSNITLDGVDINDAQTNDIQAPVLRLNSEAVEEFRVVTANATANQGRSSGAQVNLVTKSGTNNLHGALFEAHRNTIFTANNYFNNLSGTPNPKLIRNTFGGAIGGPIKKDKVFFFYSYEGRRDAADTPVNRLVPLASLGQGNLRYVDPEGAITTLTTAQLNTIFPAVGINPAAVAALNEAATKYPANNFNVVGGDSKPGQLLNTAGYRFNAKTPLSLNSHIAKVDFNLTNKQTMFVRGNFIRDELTLASRFPDTPSPLVNDQPFGIAVGHTWTISPNMVNNFRYGLTRTSYHRKGDSDENQVWFRFVFQPLNFTRDLDRVNPVHNFTDDISWVKGAHTWQFGTNIRITRNDRTSYGTAYDFAITNPSMYSSSGYSVSNPINALFPYGEGQDSVVQAAATALIGRFSQYTANFNFGLDGNLMPLGAPNFRQFGMQEYDFYVQDTWRLKSNLTLNAGLRYGVSRPVYEKQGFGTKPSIPLNEYFARRLAGAAAGTPYVEPISIIKTGTDGMYDWDKNNFQPSIGISWSPRFQNGFLSWIFGNNDASAIRAGFRMTNDYYGQQIAVSFDLNNTLGYSQSYNTFANQYNVSTRPAPLFTGYGQDIRSFPPVSAPSSVSFPSSVPSDMSRRIEESLDEGLVAPKNYTFNLTFERQLPKGLMVQLSYIGRLGRNLLATRDVMAINNLKDPKSGMDWYTAATQLAIAREKGASVSSIQPIAYFENLWPDLASVLEYGPISSTQAMYSLFQDVGGDYTYAQDTIDYYYDTPYFYQPQYGALSAWGTFANSNYHGLSVSVRQRVAKSFNMDFNYTYSHSLDDASGLQTSGGYDYSAFVLNPIRQRDNYANSDFDIRHQINANWVWQFPFGNDRHWGSSWNGPIQAIFGGWQLSGITRWNTGLPVFSPFDDARWATNWQVQSSGTRVRNVGTCPTRGAQPKLYGCNTVAAYQSWRNARPGETGERNALRLPNYMGLDMGLAKTFKMPWSEGHELQFRWDVFNVPNYQAMGAIDGSRTGFGLVLDPSKNMPPDNWSNFTDIQGNPRVMQFGLRYSF